MYGFHIDFDIFSTVKKDIQLQVFGSKTLMTIMKVFDKVLLCCKQLFLVRLWMESIGTPECRALVSNDYR